ncbi:CBS domain-containing protein [Algoriphagus aquimarinus]|uniref:CBS domain-containing protein n=1 Tax=Algoriphagus aquimarinus TaxID=237018 RepID=A0A1I1CAT4_9BACT|nr:CBS domain-containing protein [Algoriphagus aquimarinus]SFB59769.1 CBS domain-containing protein [Algoriphagus aquimarinus]
MESNMTNAQKFLHLYNELDQAFARALGHSDYESFTYRIKQLSEKNPIVRRYKDDLHQLGSLRNAIAHQSRDGRAIAEPFDETVTLLKQIMDEYSKPKLVFPQFGFEVFSVTPLTPLIDLLTEMKQKDFSQAPILDESGNVIEVISTNTISRWLFAEYENELIDLTSARISDLIPHIEIKENYSLISRSTTVYEAAEIYIRQSAENKSQLDCMIITHSGKAGEKIIGLVCIEEIAGYLMD